MNESTTRDVPEDVNDAVDADVVAIRGFPDYFISEEKEIISTKRNSVYILQSFSISSNDKKYDVVELRKNSSAHRRSVNALYEDHFGKENHSVGNYDLKDYIEYYYEDEEALEWAEEELEPRINHR